MGNNMFIISYKGVLKHDSLSPNQKYKPLITHITGGKK